MNQGALRWSEAFCIHTSGGGQQSSFDSCLVYKGAILRSALVEIPRSWCEHTYDIGPSLVLLFYLTCVLSINIGIRDTLLLGLYAGLIYSIQKWDCWGWANNRCNPIFLGMPKSIFGVPKITRLSTHATEGTLVPLYVLWPRQLGVACQTRGCWFCFSPRHTKETNMTLRQLESGWWRFAAW